MGKSETGANETTSESLNFDTTEQTPNGANKYQTARQKIDNFTEQLQTYMTMNGLPSALPRHIDHYLNMERSEIAKLSADAIGEMEFEIHTCAYYVQTFHNKQLAKAERLEYEVDALIGPQIESFNHIYGGKEKRLAAIYNNEQARRYHEYAVNARIAATRTSYLTQRLENVAKCLENIARRRHDG